MTLIAYSKAQLGQATSRQPQHCCSSGTVTQLSCLAAWLAQLICLFALLPQLSCPSAPLKWLMLLKHELKLMAISMAMSENRLEGGGLITGNVNACDSRKPEASHSA